MDIKTQLSQEHSKTITLAIVKYVGDDKQRFKQLIAIFLGNDSRLSQRAAWPLSHICIASPTLVKPYFGRLVAVLGESGHHPAIARNLLRLFQEIEIPEKHQGPLLDNCFRIIQGAVQPTAIIAFAITVAAKLCLPFPELRAELLLVLREMAQYPQTAAITVRIKKALKALS